jgi:D-alanyl-D-alanine dipeptidase
MRLFSINFTVVIGLCSTLVIFAQEPQLHPPQDFVDLQKTIPGLVVELRYASEENFTGRPITGYETKKLYGTTALMQALTKVQKALEKRGLALKIYDAYRPQRAVNDFIRWSRIPSDTLKKRTYYPSIKKDTLFRAGYIASKSGHSRGSTVDLSIVSQDGIPLDMGGEWDFFGVRSWYAFEGITVEQKAHRKLLRDLMLANGFKPYSKEWWHFTLIEEPYPDTYFDFIPN